MEFLGNIACKKMILATKYSGADFVKFQIGTQNLNRDLGIMTEEEKYL